MQKKDLPLRKAQYESLPVVNTKKPINCGKSSNDPKNFLSDSQPSPLGIAIRFQSDYVLASSLFLQILQKDYSVSVRRQNIRI